MLHRFAARYAAALALGLGLGLPGLLACTPSSDLKKLTVDEVAARVAAHDGKTFVFDDNPHDRFVKGHVPGAKWVAASEPTLADLPVDRSATLVFYCASEL